MTDISSDSNTKVVRFAIEEIPDLFVDHFRKKIPMYVDAFRYSQNRDSLSSAQQVTLAEKTLEKMSFVRRNCEHKPRTEIARIKIDQVVEQKLEPVLLVVKGLKQMPYYEALGNIQCLIGSGEIKGVADIYGVYAMCDAHELIEEGKTTPVQSLLAIGDIFKKKSSERESFVALFQRKPKDGFHQFASMQRNLDILKKGIPFKPHVTDGTPFHLSGEHPAPSLNPKEDLCIIEGTKILAFR